MTKTPAIALHNVSFRYSGAAHESLSHIDLEVGCGECIVLTGASCCGKTTLTRLLNGLAEQFYEGTAEGEVLLFGEPLRDRPIYEIGNQVGSIFQDPKSQFFASITEDEIAFGCENFGLPRDDIIARVNEALVAINGEQLRGQQIYPMSSGEKQKIAIASVNATEPCVYVFDEPSANLDMASVEALRVLMARLKASGHTLIVAEHRLYYLKELIDRVIYLKNGKIEKDYLASDALKLSAAQQAEMGLRPFDLGVFPVTAHPVASSGSIECENFHFAYTKQRDALDIDSLSLPQAGIIAVIGHNGAGKSTLARCLCGLEKHCKGIVKVDGKTYNRKQRLSLCYMVMQDVNHQLFTESTEEEMLISMAEPASDKADAILDRLDLLQFKERHPMALSGGQKQRVAIATALVSDRKILVLDEPTSGLDLQHMKEVADELVTIQKMGKTSLVITHDYELIVSCCTHVLHLEHGVVQEQYALDAAGLQLLKNFFIESR